MTDGTDGTCGACGPQRASNRPEPEPVAGNYFVSTYPPFSCWSQFETDGYREHLDRAGDPDVPLGLYVHIPFCADRCHFCYYLSHDNGLAGMDRYLDALVAELAMYAATPALGQRPLSFVYFGGGTPSLLSKARVERLLPALQDVFPWTDVREVTFECAPRSVTEGKLLALRDHGVTRLSLGVQQLDDRVLAENGRVHLVADVERAYAAIRSVGFDVVNLDLMIGLVGESDETYRASLERVIEMMPQSITTYMLEVPMNTPLWRSVRDGTLTEELSTWETKRARLRYGRERLEGAGYTMTSAYAAVRDPDRHAFVYQQAQYRGADLLGIGASAFSHVGGWNQQNRTGVDEYVDIALRGELPLFRTYSMSRRERVIREFVLQLKLGGVERDYFQKKFDVDVTTLFAEPLAELVGKGWLVVDDGGVSVTPEGILRVDRMIPAFYLPEHRGVRYS